MRRWKTSVAKFRACGQSAAPSGSRRPYSAEWGRFMNRPYGLSTRALSRRLSGRSGENQSLKFWYCSGKSVIDFLMKAIASCKSSRFLPVTRTVSPWMLACTFILLSLISLTIFFASSISTPTFTSQPRLTLLPLTFSILSLISRHLMSTPRLVSLPFKMSCTWSSWNSLSAHTVSLSSACSTRASEPLKSKRVPTSLLVCSIAFLTSVLSTSETMSKVGMVAPVSFKSTETANVVYFILGVYLKAAVLGHLEAGTRSIGLELRLVADFYAAGAGGDFHQFRCADVEGELAARHDYADSLAGAVREKYRVRHALAVEEYVGFFANRDVVEFVRHYYFPCLFFLVQIGRDAQTQRVELDEARRILLVVGALVVLEGGDGRVEQRVGLRVAANDNHVALVQFDAHPAVHALLGVVDQRLQCLAFRRPPVAVVNHRRVARHQVVFQVRDFAVQRDRLDGAVRLEHDRAAGGLVAATRLHADVAVLHQVEAADAVLAAQCVQIAQYLCGRHWVAVQRHDVAVGKFDVQVFGGIRRLLRRYGPAPHALLGFGGGIFQMAALEGDMQQVRIHRVG